MLEVRKSKFKVSYLQHLWCHVGTQIRKETTEPTEPDVWTFTALCLSPALWLKKKEPLFDDDVDNQIRSTSPSLLPMLFGEQRERVSPTQMTQQERRRSSFSKHLGPRHFVETRVDGNRALKWDEIAQEKGPGELVRPQSTSTQCPSMRERISHTQSTEFMRISRWPSRWLSKSKTAAHLRLHSTGSNTMVHAEVWRTTEGNNKAVVMVEFVVDTLVIWTPRTANCPL